jgi:hypothetical protein
MGVGYGVAAALDIFGSESLLEDLAQKNPPPSPVDTQHQRPEDRTSPAARSHSPQPAEAMIERFDRVEERLTRLENSVEASKASHDLAGHGSERGSARSPEHFVTRAELSAAMEQFSNTLDTDIQRRFDIQNRSVQSLRTMVARTDELLEQVLETIESAGIPA